MSITQEMLELVNTRVPKERERKRTLFDLSGTEYSELVFTRWYKYFLDKNENHGLHDLFLQSLLSISENKFTVTDFNVVENVQTKKGNYIDLLVQGSEKDMDKSVIIENKIRHWLHNDLLDYWTDTPGVDENKLGILLTPNTHYIPSNVKGKFVNMLHRQWLEAVITGSKSFDLKTEQRVLLEHFYNAIINISKDLTMNEQVQFFLHNIKAVNDIIRTREKTDSYIVSQIHSAANQLGYNVGSTGEHYQTVFLPNVQNIYYTILYSDLLTEKQMLGIRLEINGEVVNRIDELDIHLATEIEVAKNKGMEHNNYGKGGWKQYLFLTYPIDKTTMVNLSEFIVRKINEDFAHITNKAIEVLNHGTTIQR